MWCAINRRFGFGMPVSSQLSLPARVSDNLERRPPEPAAMEHDRTLEVSCRAAVGSIMQIVTNGITQPTGHSETFDKVQLNSNVERTLDEELENQERRKKAP